MRKGATIIEQKYFSTRQSVSYVEIYKKNDRKIKIEIKSDSYLDQCYARGSVFDGVQWHHVYNIPPSAMSTQKALAYLDNMAEAPEKAAKYMEKDVAAVIEKTEKILF